MKKEKQTNEWKKEKSKQWTRKTKEWRNERKMKENVKKERKLNEEKT